MAPARRHPPIYMLSRYADTCPLTGEPVEGWIKVECDSKKAYGCGENIQEAVKGLVLYVHLGDDPLITSFLAIRMTDEALRRFNKELELDISPAGSELRRETTAVAHVLMHAEGLAIMTMHLSRDYCRRLFYHLVYDHKRASLSISPAQVPVTAVVSMPVLKRTCNGDYEIFYMGFDHVNEFPAPLEVFKLAPLLCVFSPARAGANSVASAWEMRRNMRWSVPESVEQRFIPHLTFSFQGKGFWVDPSQGLQYCDLDAAAGDDSIVDVSYVELPRECVLDLESALNLNLDQEPMQATRTMGCDRDSIWFVCIDKESIWGDDCADNLVSMWTLKLQGGKGQWKNEVKFSLRDLWRFDGFKEAGLPEAQVAYPLLNVADGVLYLVLYGKHLGHDAETGWVDHICSFDVFNKKLLWHGTVHNFHVWEPAAFPVSFFQTEHEHHPAAGLALLLQPGSKVVRSTTTLQRARDSAKDH